MKPRLCVLVVGIGLALPLAARASYVTIHTFSQYKDGAVPFNAGVIAGDSGELYGTTIGGLDQCGGLYKLSPAERKWRSKVLWAFRGRSKEDGCAPFGRLIRDHDGTFYGVTEAGGTHGGGTAYRLVPRAFGDKTRWKEEVLWNFGRRGDGAAPIAGLLFANGTDASAGLYGTSRDGGDGFGTAFAIMPPPEGQKHWSESVLYRFQGKKDGAHPWGGLIEDADGSLFGTTYEGGYRISTHSDTGLGTVYKLTPPVAGETAWTENLIHTFTGTDDGAHPEYVDLIADRDAGKITALYGTTADGYGGNASYGYGVVFQMTPQDSGTWISKVLWTFQGTGYYDEQTEPGAGLTFVNGLDSSDGFYGTTAGAECDGFGSSFFELTLNGERSEWIVAQIFDFQFGSCPLAAPTVANENVYGTTAYFETVGSVYELQDNRRHRRK
jgi:uncharacterized repeat protein (TIGR03803 family)